MIRSWICNFIPEPKYTSPLEGAILPGQKCRKQSSKHFFLQTGSRVPMKIKDSHGRQEEKSACCSSQILSFASSPSHLPILTKTHFSWNKTKLQLIFVSYDLFSFSLVLKNLWFLLIYCLTTWSITRFSYINALCTFIQIFTYERFRTVVLL